MVLPAPAASRRPAAGNSELEHGHELGAQTANIAVFALDRPIVIKVYARVFSPAFRVDLIGVCVTLVE